MRRGGGGEVCNFGLKLRKVQILKNVTLALNDYSNTYDLTQLDGALGLYVLERVIAAKVKVLIQLCGQS